MSIIIQDILMFVVDQIYLCEDHCADQATFSRRIGLKRFLQPIVHTKHAKLQLS